MKPVTKFCTVPPIDLNHLSDRSGATNAHSSKLTTIFIPRTTAPRGVIS